MDLFEYLGTGKNEKERLRFRTSPIEFCVVKCGRSKETSTDGLNYVTLNSYGHLDWTGCQIVARHSDRARRKTVLVFFKRKKSRQGEREKPGLIVVPDGETITDHAPSCISTWWVNPLLE